MDHLVCDFKYSSSTSVNRIWEDPGEGGRCGLDYTWYVLLLGFKFMHTRYLLLDWLCVYRMSLFALFISTFNYQILFLFLCMQRLYYILV